MFVCTYFTILFLVIMCFTGLQDADLAKSAWDANDRFMGGEKGCFNCEEIFGGKLYTN